MTFDEASHIHMPVLAKNYFTYYEIYDMDNHPDVLMRVSTSELAIKVISLLSTKLKKVKLTFRPTETALPIEKIAITVEMAIEQFRKYLS